MEEAPLPSAEELSAAAAAAHGDVEAALAVDRNAERARGVQGVVGTLQARRLGRPALRWLSPFPAPQGVGVRLFAVSCLYLLLCAAVLAGAPPQAPPAPPLTPAPPADAALAVQLAGRLGLPRALGVVVAADLGGALLLLSLLLARRLCCAGAAGSEGGVLLQRLQRSLELPG